jgi:hypothetical protein
MGTQDIDLDNDFDFDIDAELSKLDDLSFGETEKPKNAREATLKVLKDAGSGAQDSFKFNKDNVGNFVKAAMPSSLRGEYYDVHDAIFGTGGIKESLDTSLKDVKSSAKSLSDSLKGILPKEGKIYTVLDKITKKLGLDDKSIEEQINNSNAALMETFRTELNNTFTKETSLAILQNNIQQKQFKSSLEVQNNINKNINVIRDFHLEITNSYYRKSLELQYRSLLANEGQLKTLTEGFNLIKTQNEAIIKNTGLPEFVKIKANEQFKQVMMANTSTNIQNFLFKEISAINKIKTSLSRRIKYTADNFMEGLNTVGQVADVGSTLKEMEGMGGPSKSFLVGNQIGNWGRDFIGKNVSERISNSNLGKKGIFNIKNIMADPGGWASDNLTKLRENRNGDQGRLGKAKDFLLDTFYSNVKDMASIGGDYVGATFSRANPNDVAVFNNSTQTSIVKIIPGLLSKIYGEVKSIRSGGNPEDFELAYDYNRQTLVTKQALKYNFLKDTSARLKSYTATSVKSILDLYSEYGSFKDHELDAINSSLISYLITSESRLNPTVIVSKEYMEHIPAGLKKRVLNAGKKILAAAKDNPFIIETLIKAMSGIRTKIPDMTTEVEMLYTTGNVPMLEEMGILVRDEVNNSFSIHRDNTLDTLRKASGMKIENKTISSARNTTLNNTNINNEKEQLNADDISEELNKKFLYNPDGTKKTINELRQEFFNSEEYKQNLVKDFPEWLEKNLGKSKNILSSLKSIPTSLVGAKNWAVDKIKQQKQLGKATEQFEDDVMDMVLGTDNKSVDDLRTEFLQSEEYQSGAVTKFPEWLDAQGLGPDGKRKKSHSRFYKLLQFTWALDRKMAKAMFKYPWKAVKGITKLGFKTTKWGLPKALNFGAKGAFTTASALPMNLYYLIQEVITGKPATGGLPTFGLDRFMAKKAVKSPKSVASAVVKTSSLFGKLKKGIARPFNWLFKAGVDAGVTNDTQVILQGLDEMNTNLSEMNANTPKKSFTDPDGDGLRKGDWRSRLKLFSSNKEAKDGDKRNKGVMNFLKENKGLTVMGGIMLISGLMKALNLSSEELVSGVKAVGRGISHVVNAVKWVGEKVGSVIDGIGGFFGIKKKTPKLDENGQPVIGPDGQPEYEEKSGIDGSTAIGTGVAVAAGLYAARHPVKATKGIVSFGKGLVEAVINLCKGKFGFGWIGETLDKNKSTLASSVDKSVGSFKNFTKYLNMLGRVVKNPKFIQRIGKKTAAKALSKITTAIAASMTGIGGLLTAGMVLWEFGWVIYYMYEKDLSFWQALLYQFLGTTITDEELEAYDKGEDPEKKAANEIQTLENGNLYKDFTDRHGFKQRLEIDHNGDMYQSDLDENGDYKYERKIKIGFRESSDVVTGVFGIDRNEVDKLRVQAHRKSVDIINEHGGSMTTADLKKAWNKTGVTASKAGTKVGDVAATYTKSSKSSGKCATGVRTILEKAGYPSPKKLGFNVGSAYMYAKPQINGLTPLEGMGYSQLNVDPANFTPSDGDIAVIDKGPKSNPKHGHIAVWSDKIKSWVSDFIQPDKSDPSPYGRAGLKARVNPDLYRDYVTFWRDVGNKPNTNEIKTASTNEGITNQSPDNGGNTVVASNQNNPTKEGMGAGDDVSTPARMLEANSNNNGISSAQHISMESTVKELNIISDTLIKSLKVQMHMAETLNKIANNDHSLNIDPNTIGKNKKNEIGGTIPPSSINLQRNQYTMPI